MGGWNEALAHQSRYRSSVRLLSETKPGTSSQQHQRLQGFGGWYERARPTILERPKAVDLAVVAIAIVIAALLDTRYRSTDYPLFLAIMLLANGSLYWRRTYPAAVLLLTTGAYGYLMVWTDTGLQTPVFALYAWIVYGRNRQLVWTGTVAAVLAVLGIEAIAASNADRLQLGFMIEVAIIIGLTIGTADRSVQRRRYLDEVEERVARLETERQQAVDLAAQEERARVAREMHDVVAHSVSVMLVQATAAKWVLDTSPEQSKTALENIENSGREALTDLRRVLGLLRETDLAEYAPNPTLAKIPELVENTNAAGHSVSYSLEGDHVVPVGVQTTLYRITQEALTNVMKHAGEDVNVLIRVTTTAQQAKIRIVDDGKGAAASVQASRPGLGLVGMKERVSAFGGELFTRPRPGGGFEVRASLPYALPVEPHASNKETVS